MSSKFEEKDSNFSELDDANHHEEYGYITKIESCDGMYESEEKSSSSSDNSSYDQSQEV